MSDHVDIYHVLQSRTTNEVAVAGTRGAAASAHPLATGAGLAVLRAGGNAVDAAVAMSATLGVVEPAMSGPGGTGCMLMYRAAERDVCCLDFSSRLPARGRYAGLTPDELMTGTVGALVPSAPAGWLAAHREFGSLDLADLFADAIEHATRGVPLTPKTARVLSRSQERFAADPGLLALYFPGGRVPMPGDLIANEDLANTYEALARDGCDSFYRGAIARELAAATQAQGGFLSEEDLASYTPTLRDAQTARYRDLTVFTIGSPSAGAQLCDTVRLLDGFDLRRADPAERAHLILESIKSAVGARRKRLIESDGPFGDNPSSEADIESMRSGLSRDCAAPSDGDRVGHGGVPVPGSARGLGKLVTTAFGVCDRWGDVVVSTLSLGQLFGGARLLGRTGVVCNDFAWWCDPAGPLAAVPGREIASPLVPLLARGDDGRVLGISIPGGNGIMQTLPQLLVNVVDLRLGLAAAVEAPRFLSFGRHPWVDPWGPPRAATSVAAEDRLPREVVDGLVHRGHVVELLGDWSHAVGAAAIVQLDAAGVMWAAADPRRDGSAAAW